MEALIEAYLRALAIQFNPYFNDNEDSDDSTGIIVYKTKSRPEATDMGPRWIYKTYEYILLIGQYEDAPNMESVVNYILFNNKPVIGGYQMEVEWIEGESDLELVKTENGNKIYNYFDAILVKFKYLYKIVEVV